MRISKGAKARAAKPEVRHQFPPAVRKSQRRIQVRRKDHRWDGVTMIHLMQRRP